MTHLTPSKNRKPGVLSGRISVAAFSAVAAAAFMFSAGSAQAGPADLAAIKAELKKSNLILSGTPKTGQTVATLEQVLTAVQNIVDAKVAAGLPSAKLYLQIGNILGEALKTPQAKLPTSTNAGTLLGDIAVTALGTPDSATLQKVLSLAAKGASIGAGASAVRVPDFVGRVLDLSADADADAIAAAALIGPSSKTAVAAIISGYAAEVGTAQDLFSLANSAVTNTKLTAAGVEITKAISERLAVVDQVNADENIGILVENLADVKQGVSTKALPVGTIAGYAKGALMAKPEAAGRITDSLLNTDKPLVKTSILKGISTYAKTIAAAADIEQISVVGAQLAGKIGSGEVSTGLASGLAKTLSQAIFSKPQLTETGKYSIENRIDEISEVAAYVLGGVLGNTSTFINPAKDYKAAKGVVLGIIKSAIAGSASKSKPLKAINAAMALQKADLLAHITGSVALTIEKAAGLDANLKSALVSYLQLETTVKAIAGKTVALQDAVRNAITAGLTGNPPAMTGAFGQIFYENGTPITNIDALLAALVDPETENKNY